MENDFDSWMEMSIIDIIAEYNGDFDEPLDGDAADELLEILKAEINLHQGNITEEEYKVLLG